MVAPGHVDVPQDAPSHRRLGPFPPRGPVRRQPPSAYPAGPTPSPGAPTAQYIPAQPAALGSAPPQFAGGQPGFLPGSGSAVPHGPQKPSADLVPKRRFPHLRRLAIVLVSVVGVLAVALGVTGYLYYDKATAPDRSAPDVVVDNFLREYLVHRNDEAARQFTCSDQSELVEIARQRDDIQQREQTFSVKIAVTWGSLDVGPESNGAVPVTTKLILSTDTNLGPQEDQEVWQFQVRQESGWRVCGAHQVP